MKCRTFSILALIVMVLVTLGIRFLIPMMFPGKQRIPGLRETGAIYTWLNAWSLEHDGQLPARLEDLTVRDIGVPDDFERYLKRVIEYPGAGKNLKSLDEDFVILRCRAGRQDELEARVNAAGSTRVFEPE